MSGVRGRLWLWTGSGDRFCGRGSFGRTCLRVMVRVMLPFLLPAFVLPAFVVPAFVLPAFVVPAFVVPGRRSLPFTGRIPVQFLVPIRSP